MLEAIAMLVAFATGCWLLVCLALALALPFTHLGLGKQSWQFVHLVGWS